MKSTNAYKSLRVSYIYIYIVCLLFVSATLQAIITDVLHYKGNLQQKIKQMHKCKTLSFKMYGLKYTLKYKIQLKINIATFF
jgi:hypothetical protein